MRGSIRVLHVDDDRDFAALAADTIERIDPAIDLEHAPSADAGRDRLAEGAFDCVVSDYDMPGASGLEFLAAVTEAHPTLPFILFTGKGSEEVAAEAISAGVTDYLQKGGTETFELLANRIEHAVEQREHRRRFDTLVDTFPGVVYRARHEPPWPMELLRGEVEAITGHPPAALLEGRVTWGDDLVHPDDHDAVWSAVEAGVAADERFECIYRIVAADGETRWVWERGMPVGTDDGVVILEGTITDITDRKRRERELETERNRFEAVFDSVPAPTVHVVFENGEPIVHRANAAFASVFGHDPKAATGRSIDELIVPATERDTAASLNEAVRTEAYQQAEVVRETPDGVRPFLFTARTFHLEGDRLEGVATYVDLTEQTQREARLERQNERLDQFVDLISHDLRNPLNVATGRIDLARSERDFEHLDIAAESLERMATMIDELVAAARDDDAD